MILPDRDCPLCPRLVEFRLAARVRFPDWHNAPVVPFGSERARLLIVGLAPGLQGANRTGRPFTGDYAGNLLYATLKAFGLARGEYEQRPDDTLQLVNCRISNAVKCVPPENKPTPEEIRICNRFLSDELSSLPNLKAVLALGSIAHDAVLVGLGQRKSSARFAHGARHALPRGLVLFDSYHCSRYNTNTGRLTAEMFQDVVGRAAAAIA
ncbi:MAG TPA: uracil-DNA glycosylase [Dongiaceae bacterium]|jgi:uracil-DNA glycosylase family 4|nr:uracil-DNA glycosylase [Dongiaceae bacterium]